MINDIMATHNSDLVHTAYSYHYAPLVLPHGRSSWENGAAKVLTLLEAQSRFADGLLEIRVEVSPKQECGSNTTTPGTDEIQSRFSP